MPVQSATWSPPVSESLDGWKPPASELVDTKTDSQDIAKRPLLSELYPMMHEVAQEMGISPTQPTPGIDPADIQRLNEVKMNLVKQEAMKRLSEGKTAKVMRGVQEAFVDLAGSFKDPLNVALIGATAVAPELGVPARLAVQGAVAGVMAKPIAQTAGALSVPRSLSLDQWIRQAIGLGVQTVMAAGPSIAAKLFKPPASEMIAGAQKSAEAVRDTAKIIEPVAPITAKVLESTPENRPPNAPLTAEEQADARKLLSEELESAEPVTPAIQMPSDKPVITAAAVLDPNSGNWWQGPNHPSIEKHLGMPETERAERNTSNYGFVVRMPDGSTKIVSRKLATTIAKKSGQAIADWEPGTDLHSDMAVSAFEPSKAISETEQTVKPVPSGEHKPSGGTEVKPTAAESPEVREGAAPSQPHKLIPPGATPGPATKPESPETVLESAQSVKVQVPEGATQIRVTTPEGKISVQPLSNVNKGDNPFHGVKISKIEAGTIGRDKKFKPIQGNISVGPGAASPGDVPIDPQEKQLLAALDAMQASTGPVQRTRIKPTEAIADAIAGTKDAVNNWWLRTKAGGEQFRRLLTGPPPLEGPFWGVKADWTANRQVNGGVAKAIIDRARKIVPNPRTRQGMGKYAEALMRSSDPESGFKTAEAQLENWASTSKLASNRLQYQAALKLSPDQKQMAQQALQYFLSKGEQLKQMGLLRNLIEDYAGQHMVDRANLPSSAVSQFKADLVSGKLNTNFKYALKRTFETEHQLEQAGYKLKTTDLFDKLANYAKTADNVLADRAAVKAWMAGETKDGRPLIATGIGHRLEDIDVEKNEALFINPKLRPNPVVKDAAGNRIDVRGEYVKLDHPAFKKWQWYEVGDGGQQIFVSGDVWVHKSIAGELQNTLGRSRLYDVPGVDTLTRVNAEAKGIKLIGAFHQVKTGSHALFHLTKPWGQPPIDVHSTKVYDAMRHGLQLFDGGNQEMFSEGLAASGLAVKLGKITGIAIEALTGSERLGHALDVGRYFQAYQEYLFQDYIPRIKYATYQNALARNLDRYGKELPESRIKQITATQVNSAYGELNWRLLGINPTFKHALQLAILAPDFQAAQTGFGVQAFTKYGGEQRMTTAIMVGSVYLGARIANQLLDNDPHWEFKRAFSIVHGGREYGIRTIAQDAVRAATETRNFLTHRMSPVLGSAEELRTREDMLGRKETGEQAAVNTALRFVPIPFTPRSDIGWIESALTSTLGAYDKRYSPISDMQSLAIEWRKKNDPKYPVVAQFPESPYRSLSQRLDDNDLEGAKKEYERLLKTHTAKQVRDHYSKRPLFTGRISFEDRFKATLNDQQRKRYQEAVDMSETRFQRFQEITQ